MNKKALVIGLGLLALAGVALAAQRQFSSDTPAADPASSGDGGQAWDSGAADWITFWTTQNAQEIEANAMPISTPSNAQTNIAAALSAIMWAEGTAGQPDPYRVCFGYRHVIASLADHPAVTGEWSGEPLSDAQCRGAGLGPGCVSTAAGAYQLIKPTWLKLKARLGLADFSAASQTAAATELLRECGAVAYLEQGKFPQAISAARKIWASLPGAGYGQGERSLASLQARYTQAGGVLA